MQGVSLLDIATGKSETLSRDAVFGEIFTHDAASLDEPELSLTHLWIRKGDWKLIVPQPGAEESDPQLFNITKDPTEQKDLATQREAEVRRLHERIEQWWGAMHPQ